MTDMAKQYSLGYCTKKMKKFLSFGIESVFLSSCTKSILFNKIQWAQVPNNVLREKIEAKKVMKKFRRVSH